jgi:serine/threonine protein kinase
LEASLQQHVKRSAVLGLRAECLPSSRADQPVLLPLS